MTDANVQAILGNPPAPTNPLQILSGWQDYANKVAQNRQIQASTGYTQQATQNAALQNQVDTQKYRVNQSSRSAQLMYSLSNMSDSQLTNGAPLYQVLQRGLSNGNIDPTEAAGVKAELDGIKAQYPNGDAPGYAYRPLLSQHFASSLAGPQAVDFLVGKPITLDNGQTVQGGVQAGAGSGQNGALIMQGSQVPIGYQTQSQLHEQVTVPDGKGGVMTGPRWMFPSLTGAVTAPGSAPAKSSPMGSGAYPAPATASPTASPAPSPATPTPSPGPPATAPGSQPQVSAPADPYANGPVSVPAGQQTLLDADHKAYIADSGAVQGRLLNAQNQRKALDALQAVQTGSGNEWLAGGRAKMVTLLGELNIRSPLMSKQDFSKAEAEKLLTDYARSSGSAPSSVAQLEASEHSNPSTIINNEAAQDFVRTNIGFERMKAAAAMVQGKQDSRGNGYTNFGVDFASKNDRRGFAYDSYSPSQLTSMVSKMSATEQEKFFRSMNLARELKMLGTQSQDPAPQPASPPASNATVSSFFQPSQTNNNPLGVTYGD